MGLVRLCAIFWVLLGTAAASEPSIVVFGNRSLKPEAVIRMSGLHQDPTLQASEIKKRLQTTSLFSSVEVFRDEDIVTIYIHEKNTWFVLPYFSKDPGQVTYGVAFGKATIYGRDASVIGRYQVGTSDHEFSMLGRDEAAFGTPLVVGASLDYEDSLHRIYEGREIVHHTRNQYHGGSFQTGYRPSPHVFLTLNNYCERHRFEELSGEYFSGVQWSHKLIGEYSHLYVNEGLTEGAAVRAYFESTNPISSFQFKKTGISTQAGIFLKGDFNWILTERVEYSPSLPRYQLFELGGVRLRGFPSQEFRDHYYGSVQNDMLIGVVNFWDLKLRPLAFADWAFVQDSGRTAVGVGFQIYVKTIAIPAVQFFAGYGFNPAGFSASAAIGPQL